MNTNKVTFKKGDIVKSVVYGYYFGLKAKIIDESRMYYQDGRIWIVKLLNSGKKIYIKESYLEKLDE